MTQLEREEKGMLQECVTWASNTILSSEVGEVCKCGFVVIFYIRVYIEWC